MFLHLLTVGKSFNERSVPCAFGIKIGLYFHKSTVILIDYGGLFLCPKTA